MSNRNKIIKNIVENVISKIKNKDKNKDKNIADLIQNMSVGEFLTYVHNNGMKNFSYGAVFTKDSFVPCYRDTMGRSDEVFGNILPIICNNDTQVTIYDENTDSFRKEDPNKIEIEYTEYGNSNSPDDDNITYHKDAQSYVIDSHIDLPRAISQFLDCVSIEVRYQDNFVDVYLPEPSIITPYQIEQIKALEDQIQNYNILYCNRGVEMKVNLYNGRTREQYDSIDNYQNREQTL